MTKRGRPTADERAARDERVLDVATDLFLANGFSGVTLDRVAADAGVTKRTLYVSVGDKHELLRAVVRRQHTYSGAPTGDLESTAAGIARALLTDRAVALHRLVIAEAGRNPELAREFHEAGPLAAQAALVRAGATPETAAESAPVAIQAKGILSHCKGRSGSVAFTPGPSLQAALAVAKAAAASAWVRCAATMPERRAEIMFGRRDHGTRLFAAAGVPQAYDDPVSGLSYP